ncbi:hypothetical protein [Oceanobacillus manasiensis]|uniref:hypothetical protein n=1 Tax=Oceanobacillus manasiensis TaxID=586413 RepID=UPI0005AAF215|nr:hypothetical protein [Oceanobacillus manasiensis]
MTKKTIERGQSITFRVPSDTPDYLLKQLQQLKETARRNFSSEIAQFVLKGLNENPTRERESITVPLPQRLTKEQKSWLKHEHSEALIGSLVYQLLSDPMRATTLLASLNRDAYHLEDEPALHTEHDEPVETMKTEEKESHVPKNLEIDLDDVDIDGLEIETTESVKQEPQEEDPLGDFFASMNK